MNRNDPTGRISPCLIDPNSSDCMSCVEYLSCDASSPGQQGCDIYGEDGDIYAYSGNTGIGPVCEQGGGGGFSGGGGSTGPDCDSITAAVGFTGLTYANASEIWSDGNLSSYSNDSGAATIAAMAAVTWQGESGFSLNPINNPNTNKSGQVWSVDYGPFMINNVLQPGASGSVLGTAGAGQRFNGSADANISFGITLLEGLNSRFGNNAPGYYVGSLKNWTTTTPDHQAGTPINANAQKRESTWNSWKGKLTSLFSNTDCFSHQ